MDDKRGAGDGEEKAPLVIAVAVPRWAREQERREKEAAEAEGTAAGKTGEKTLEEQAAEELAREARGACVECVPTPHCVCLRVFV